MEKERQRPLVQVIVPARNEQDCLGACLESLVRQQGIDFEITVVDDGSTDQTRAIAESFTGVRVISASDAEAGVTGKCNALICGAREARAEWLLFTDADTVHSPGSLAASVKEAVERGVDLLSYSPEQETVTWFEKAVLPAVFAELTTVFPFQRINDPGDSLAAANGQYILVRREIYEKQGGHRTVANHILEDLELARTYKRAGCKIWFTHGAGMVRARMYRTFSAMTEGWTKSLALLFPDLLKLAVTRIMEFSMIVGPLIAGIILTGNHSYLPALLWFLIAALTAANFVFRIRAAHFRGSAALPLFIGLPLFSWLLVRSYIHWHLRKTVVWKGRFYLTSEPNPGFGSSIQEKTQEG
jgi:glycosyltransferase involved in cell wall biosynthesis